MASPIDYCQICNKAEILFNCETCSLLMCKQCNERIHSRLKVFENHSVVLFEVNGKVKHAVGAKVENFSSMFASCKKYQSQKVNNKVIGSVRMTYKTDLPAVYQLLCFDDDKVYYSNNRVKKIVKAKLHHSSIQILRTSERQIVDLTINSEGKLLIALNDRDSELAVLHDNGDMETLYDITPMKILGLHYNKSTEELYIGATDSGPPYLVTQYSTRPVIILGQDNERKHTIEFSTKGKRLFTYPHCITTDLNGMVYVIDSLNEDSSGRIVAVNRDGQLKYTYSGYAGFNTSLFNPTDIAVTKSNKLVIADLDNHALHVLQAEGHLIGLQNIEELGIIFPCSLCVNSENFILIGCNTYYGDQDHAKIHVVELNDM